MHMRSIAAAAFATAVACGPVATTPSSAPATSARAATTAPTAAPTAKPLTATAELKDKDGAVVGTATLTEQGNGVRVVLSASKLPAGQHGWHIHTIGKCEPVDFTGAGAHFNPDAKQHGAQNPLGPHAGDLGNLTAAADGTAKADVVAKVTLGTGTTSLFDADGSAIVIHASPDDEKTDPTGNSGGRIACGVVKAG